MQVACDCTVGHMLKDIDINALSYDEAIAAFKANGSIIEQWLYFHLFTWL